MCNPALFAVAPQDFVASLWSFFMALFPLLKMMFTSGWGWFYIIMTILIAVALGRKNILWLVLGIITYIGLMTGWQAELVPVAGKLIASGPAPALTGFFQLSSMNVNMGTKAVILGAWFCYGLIPLMINVKQATALMQKGAGHSSDSELDLDDPVAMTRLSIASLLFLCMPFFFVISLWKALFALHYGADITPLFGIANITVPHWKPVWHLNYFVPAVLTAGISYLTTILSRQLFIIPAQVSPGCLMAISGFFLFLASMFVPVGLVLVALGSSILWLIWMSFEVLIKE